jgi:hypothetical protein
VTGVPTRGRLKAMALARAAGMSTAARAGWTSFEFQSGLRCRPRGFAAILARLAFICACQPVIR